MNQIESWSLGAAAGVALFVGMTVLQFIWMVVVAKVKQKPSPITFQVGSPPE